MGFWASDRLTPVAKPFTGQHFALPSMCLIFLSHLGSDVLFVIVQGLWGVPDRLPLHGGRGEVHLGSHGRPQRHGQPGDPSRQHSVQGDTTCLRK